MSAGIATTFWQRRLSALPDAALAALLAERGRWRHAQLAELPVWVREWAANGHPEARWYVDYWDGGVTWAWDAITAPVVDEAIRRLRRRTLPQGRLTTPALLAAFPDRLEAAGEGRWRARCPWHDDTHPSLIVYGRDWCHCYVCGAHRPVADLALAWKGAAA